MKHTTRDTLSTHVWNLSLNASRPCTSHRALRPFGDAASIDVNKAATYEEGKHCANQAQFPPCRNFPCDSPTHAAEQDSTPSRQATLTNNRLLVSLAPKRYVSLCANPSPSAPCDVAFYAPTAEASLTCESTARISSLKAKTFSEENASFCLA